VQTPTTVSSYGCKYCVTQQLGLHAQKQQHTVQLLYQLSYQHVYVYGRIRPNWTAILPTLSKFCFLRYCQADGKSR